MTVYRIETPDGSVLRIEGPEGASQDQLIQVAQQHYAASQPKAPVINSGALADTVKDLPRYGGMALDSAVTGAMDLAVGAGQLVSKALPQGLTDRYSEAMRQREANYQEGRAGYENVPDVGRFTGNLIAGGGAMVGPRAATIGARMVQGAKGGLALGTASPVDPDAGSYAASKAIQMGGGAAAGAVAVPVVEGLVRGAGAAINALANAGRGVWNTMTAQTGSGTIQQTLQAEMGKAGVDWSALPEMARRGLVAEVQRSLKAGGAIDLAAVERLATFHKLGIKPTQGQITRDPVQFARERNYSTLEPGKPLAERFNEQNTQLIGTLDAARANAGGTAPDAYAAGKAIIGDLRATDAARKATVRSAYDTARAEAGIEADVPLQPVAQRLGQLIEDFGDDKIPGAVSKRLQEFGLMEGKQTRVFNIREAEKLKTLIGNNIDNPQTPSGKALTLLKNSVDDAVNAIGDDAGSQAAGAFQEARKLAADRFGKLDRAPALANAVGRDTIAPEKFIDTYIVKGEIQDVANLLRNMKPEARAEARAAVIDWIRNRAVSGVEDTAKFSQGAYSKAIQALGARKLELIFAGDREVLTQLETLRKAGAYAQVPPISSGVNYSNSANAAADMLDQLTRLPIAGLLGRPGDLVRSQQVNNALLRLTPTKAPRNALAARTIDNAAMVSGEAAPIGVAGAISQTLDTPHRNQLRVRQRR